MNGLRRLLFSFSLILICAAKNPAVYGATPVYPLKASPNGRYLLDQNDVPYLMIGDSPQALIANLTETEAELFFADRAAYGFNTIWINLLCATYTGGRADGSTIDGTLPFTDRLVAGGSYDLSKTNEAYFAHVDRIINLAAAHGLLVLLDPIETGSWIRPMLDNGTNKCRAFGQFLGRRYKDFDNILWMSGNDFQGWRNTDYDAVVRAVAVGIQEMDSRHLHTLELDYFVSSSLDDSRWASLLGVNATYTYYPTYAQLLKDYNRTNFLPSFMVEANYEFEHDWTGNETLRRQEYWTMLSGATGQLYGNRYSWPFISGWQSHLDTPGVTQLGCLKNLFEPRAWYDLVPDQNHAVVTAGYGTFSASGNVNANDYATAARTPDGSLVMVYMPTLRTLTVDLTKLSGSATARWYDPASGSYVPIAGSPLTNSGTGSFTPPGNNSDGDGDWVLILETNPSVMRFPPGRPAFVQQNYAAPRSPQTQLSVSYLTAQTAGDANILAIGWNDIVASITSVSDSMSNVYQAAVPTYRGNGLSQAIYYAANINGGNNTVTVTFSQPAVYVDVRAAEYFGLSPTNTFQAGRSASGNGSIASTGSLTTTVANELLFGAGITAAGFTAPAGGFTKRVITAEGDIVEDLVALNPRPYSAPAFLNSGSWLMQVAAFMPAPPPSLRIFVTASNGVILAWPAPSTGFTLQENANLGTTNWISSPNSISVVSGENQVAISPITGSRFYRLIDSP